LLESIVVIVFAHSVRSVCAVPKSKVGPSMGHVEALTHNKLNQTKLILVVEEVEIVIIYSHIPSAVFAPFQNPKLVPPWAM